MKRLCVVKVADKERLVRATSAREAADHCTHVYRASPDDVARLLGAGVAVEETAPVPPPVG